MLGGGLAVAAGLFAALASVCAKLAAAGEATLNLCEAAVNLIRTTDNLGTHYGPILGQLLPPCDSVVLYVRVAFFLMVFVSNALMWTLYVKSMQLCATTTQATVTNAAANFFFSALLGRVLFGESLSLMWWTGASLIIIGLLLIHRGTHTETKLKHS